MTLTVDLTPDQEEQLRREAEGRGLAADDLFRQLLNQTLTQLGTLPPLFTARVAGLHAGQIWMADDFDDPLPDSFWLGEK